MRASPSLTVFLVKLATLPAEVNFSVRSMCSRGFEQSSNRVGTDILLILPAHQVALPTQSFLLAHRSQSSNDVDAFHFIDDAALGSRVGAWHGLGRELIGVSLC
jgi:hypothetical protein